MQNEKSGLGFPPGIYPRSLCLDLYLKEALGLQKRRPRFHKLAMIFHFFPVFLFLSFFICFRNLLVSARAKPVMILQNYCLHCLIPAVIIICMYPEANASKYLISFFLWSFSFIFNNYFTFLTSIFIWNGHRRIIIHNSEGVFVCVNFGIMNFYGECCVERLWSEKFLTYFKSVLMGHNRGKKILNKRLLMDLSMEYNRDKILDGNC